MCIEKYFAFFRTFIATKVRKVQRREAEGDPDAVQPVVFGASVADLADRTGTDYGPYRGVPRVLVAESVIALIVNISVSLKEFRRYRRQVNFGC